VLIRHRLEAFIVLAVLCVPAAYGSGQTIIVVGDSLSSGYGFSAEQSWVALLQNRLQSEGYVYDVVNASIAGDTTAGGLARLPRLLERYSPEVVVLELGGNDGLRGLPVTALRSNLAEMIELSKARGAGVLLAGIRIPPNYGPAYTEALAAVYAELAQLHGVALVPFLLEGVALDPALMQADRVHPNAAAQDIILDNVWQALKPLL
jgi:acyl-CoA thioesterase-1